MLSKTDTKRIKALEKNRNKIFSTTGGWKPGKGVYSHGYSMLEELLGTHSYFQIVILNATGRLVERRLADWAEAIYGCLSWPDSRIWCNQIGTFGGEMKATAVSATVAGTLAADSQIYGVYTLFEGSKFIKNSMEKYSAGMSVSEIIDETIYKNRGKPMFMGYMRPIAKGDERIVAMEKITKNLGFEVGPHLKLAYEIEKELQKRFDEGMNINGYMSAFLSDQGFSTKEMYNIYSTTVMSGVTACFLEQEKKEPDSFLPLRCDDIKYTGPKRRQIEEHK
jgi:citrate synthase